MTREQILAATPECLNDKIKRRLGRINDNDWNPIKEVKDTEELLKRIGNRNLMQIFAECLMQIVDSETGELRSTWELEDDFLNKTTAKQRCQAFLLTMLCEEDLIDEIFEKRRSKRHAGVVEFKNP